jgi:NodT family efflux transporter outer membrane factor (OMF) lipoprotein
MLLLGAAACKAPKIAAYRAGPLPGAFTGRDSLAASAPEMSWNSYFNDPRLRRLVDSALRSNPDVLGGLQRIQIARANRAIAGGALFPSVNAVATAAGERYGDYTMNGVGNFDTNLSPNIDGDKKIPEGPTTDFFLGLRSSWEIDIWGKIRDRRNAARQRFLASLEGQRWLVTQVVSEVASHYYEVLAYDNQLRILDRNLRLQSQAIEIVQAQLEGGRATSLAVQQFRAQLLNTRSQAETIQQSRHRVNNELNMLLGRYPEPLQKDSTLGELALPATISGDFPTSTILRRPDIREAELELQAGNADVSAARKAFLPSLNLNFLAAANAFRMPVIFNPGSLVYGVIGGLTGPIFNQRAIRGQFAVSSANQSKAFQDYRKSLLQAFGEVDTELGRMQRYKKAFELKRAETDTLYAAVNTANELYLAGYANYLEVITAQRSALTADLEQAVLKKEIFLANVQLYRALGGG